MEEELELLHQLLLQKDVEMVQLELYGLNSRTLCIFLTQILPLQNTQHYLPKMGNNTRTKTQLQKTLL